MKITYDIILPNHEHLNTSTHAEPYPLLKPSQTFPPPQVCSVACPLASSPHLSPTKVLDSLDSALTNHTAFVRAEILNILSAKLL